MCPQRLAIVVSSVPYPRTINFDFNVVRLGFDAAVIYDRYRQRPHIRHLRPRNFTLHFAFLAPPGNIQTCNATDQLAPLQWPIVCWVHEQIVTRAHQCA